MRSIGNERRPGAAAESRVQSGSGGARVWALALIAVSGLMVIHGVSVAANAKPPAEIDPSASCVTSDCHAALGERSHLHWPDFEKPGQCQECHLPDGNRHEFDSDETGKACLRCHEDLSERITAAKNTHEALEDGCLECHDPHGAEVENLLLRIGDDEDLKPLCFECHEDVILGGEYRHGPADLGACTMCHDPHASSEDSLLLAEGIELCAGCHEEITEGIEGATYVHDPAEDDCVDCHDPHSGPAPLMLPAVGRQLCNECHDDIVEAAENAEVDHSPVLEGDECLRCHSPHASNSSPILREPQRDLCLSCHDKPVKSGESTLLDMAKWLRENKEWHKPVLEDDCAGCHQPHGSANFRLLKELYPSRFYASFDIAKYALCFSCHEKSIVTEQRTRTLTGFRDGDRNLHFLHVNKEKRGRTCRACHEVHASQFPLHIREKVPYGKWMMPINFKKTEAGGSCHAGCHKLKAYDREAEDYREEEEST